MDVRWTWLFLDLPERLRAERSVFWQAVSGASLSPWRGQQDEFATLLPVEGSPWVKVQRVGGPGGVHVDLEVAEPLPEAAARARAVGAAVLAAHDDVVVCASPGGLAFCLTSYEAGTARRRQARDGAGSLLDQVCLDIPRGRHDEEVAFWSALTGWAVAAVPGHDEFERLVAPPDLPLRWLLQRTDDSHGPVRAHVDLSSRDRPEVVARHVALGALEGGTGRGWTVMADPGGLVYCVTDRRPGADPTG